MLIIKLLIVNALFILIVGGIAWGIDQVNGDPPAPPDDYISECPYDQPINC